MDIKYRDFDEFFGEIDQKPALRIRLFGKDYTLPSELPATTMLEAYRAYKNGEQTISDGKQMEIAVSMLGEENVTEWCERGLSMSQLTEIMSWVAKQHQSSGGQMGGKK